MSRSQHAQHLLGLHFLQKSVKKSKFWTLLIIVTQFYVKVEPNSTFLAPHIQSHCANIQPWRESFHFSIFFAQLSCEIKRWTTPKKVCWAQYLLCLCVTCYNYAIYNTPHSPPLSSLIATAGVQLFPLVFIKHYSCTSWTQTFDGWLKLSVLQHTKQFL